MTDSTAAISDAAASEHSFRRAKRTVLFGTIAAVVGLALFLVWREMYGEKFTISRETTYITEPIREDGLPDYAAALDAIASEGVTPENNAAVLYWQAFGPAETQPGIRDEFFRRLGIPTPSATGDYLLTSSAFETELETRSPAGSTPAESLIPIASGSTEKFHVRIDRARKTPWSAEDDPEMAEWIARNEKPLELIVEGTRRPRRYQPIIVPTYAVRPGMLIGALSPWASSERDTARLLCVRAMGRLHQGDVTGVQEDLLACHRLARHAASGPWLIEWLAGAAIEGLAFEADAAVAHHAELTSDQASAYRERLAALPPLSPLADKFDRGERFAMLDAIVYTSRYGMDWVDFGALFPRPPTLLVHWDVALGTENDLSDRMVAAARETDRVDRRDRLDDIRQRYEEMSADAWNRMRLINDRSGLAADILLSALRPGIDWTLREVEMRMHGQLVQLAFALAAHRADHGTYPGTLDELAPRHIDALPQDLFTGKPLIYRPTDDGGGYLLYSVGQDEVDDDGRGRDDEPPGDDIAIRTPGAAAMP